MKYFCSQNFSKSWTLHAFRFGLEMSHCIVSVKDFRLECFCFLLSCISKIIYTCSVITLPFNSDGLLRQNSLLVFSWMDQLFLFWIGGCVQNFPVCLSACRSGSFGTDLYTCLFNGCGCLLYQQFWICDLRVSVFVSCFRFWKWHIWIKQGFEVWMQSINDFRHNRTQWAAVKQAYC